MIYELNEQEVSVVSGGMGGGGYSAHGGGAGMACANSTMASMVGGAIAGLSGFIGGPAVGLVTAVLGAIGGAIAGGGGCMQDPVTRDTN